MGALTQVPTRTEASPVPVISCFQRPANETMNTQPGFVEFTQIDKFTEVDYVHDDAQS